MARDEHGKALIEKFARNAASGNADDLSSFPFAIGWDQNYWPPGTGTISGPVVNAILRRISAVGVEVNLNGILEWDTSISYKDDAIVKGSDGLLYQAQQAIDTPSDRLVDPTTDRDGSHWQLITARYLADLAAAQTGTDNTELMTPLRVRQAITALLATAAQAQAGSDPATLMTPRRVRDAITALLATAAQARRGNDNDVLMTPLRVRDAITALLATAAQAQTGTDPARLMTPVRVRDAITALIASVAEAEAGAVNNKLMTPARVQNFIDRNPPSVSRHDSPVITLDAPTGSVVDTSSTLGNSEPKEFQPLLVAARARGGYSVGNEVAVGYHLGDDMDIHIRKVSNSSFAVHCPAGDIQMPITGDPNGLYMFANTITRVWRDALPVPTAAFSLGSLNIGNVIRSTESATYWPVSGEEKIYIVSRATWHLYEILNPLAPADTRDLGRLPTTVSSNATGLAAHEVSGDMRLYSIGNGHQLFRVNPADPDDETGDYGRVTGNITVSGAGGYHGLASHGDPPVLYGLFTRGGTARLVQINIDTPSSSTILAGSMEITGTADSLFSDGTSLYFFTSTTTSIYLYRITSITPSVTRTLVGQVSGAGSGFGIAGACVVRDFSRTHQTMSLGNTGDSAADFNLKIRYAA